MLLIAAGNEAIERRPVANAFAKNQLLRARESKNGVAPLLSPNAPMRFADHDSKMMKTTFFLSGAAVGFTVR